MQVLGLFAITATAAGSLYFLDNNQTVSRSGLNAVAILLLLLNLGYLLCAATYIAAAGANSANQFLNRHFSSQKDKADHVLHVRQAWQSKPFSSSMRRRHQIPLHEMTDDTNPVEHA